MHLADEHYAELIDLLRGHAVGLVVNRFGNFGDQMIRRATLELFARNGITCRLLTDDELATGKMPADVTLIAEPGGGNVGARFQGSPRRRQRLAAVPGPKIVLPQTASDPLEDLRAFETVFVREETTWNMLRAVHPDVRLAPDMALSLRLPASTPSQDEGIYFRADIERTSEIGVDPLRGAKSMDEYLELAGSYRRVVTNRLHFGIAALLQGQACVLKANNYHKNRSVYESWLAHHFPLATWGE